MTNPEAKRMVLKLHQAGFTSLGIARRSACQRGRGYVVTAYEAATAKQVTFDNVYDVLERLNI